MSETPSNALHVIIRVIPMFMATSLSGGHNLHTCGEPRLTRRHCQSLSPAYRGNVSTLVTLFAAT
jgi:hypothetical protein